MPLSRQGRRVQYPIHKCSPKEKTDRSQYRWKAFQGGHSLTISEMTEDMSKAMHNKHDQVRYKEKTATSFAHKQKPDPRIHSMYRMIK